jgi:hypothetical protein
VNGPFFAAGVLAGRTDATEALRILGFEKRGRSHAELLVTTEDAENKYARFVLDLSGNDAHGRHFSAENN